MKKIILFLGLSIYYLTGFTQETGTFTDTRDGKVYKTVVILGQTWFAENLAFKVKGDCWAYNENEVNVATYGYLYSWKEAKEACPKGWHIPSDAEWSILTDYLGDETAGGKLKESGLTHWKTPNQGATNETGFNALPGGYRLPTDKTFLSLGYVGYWWTATELKTGRITYKFINWETSKVFSTENSRRLAFSVRCIMD